MLNIMPASLKDKYDIIIIGGGPAGLAAAVSAREAGAEDVLVLERNHDLGGILNQCIHNGFGLHYFKRELTGPEYAQLFVEKAAQSGVSCLLGAMVLEIETKGTGHHIHAISKEQGYMCLEARAVVLAMGCRERTRGAIGIPGTRPSGIFTAGAAQLYMNIEGFKIGERVVILGSGDIGLIMARRISLEGGKVLGVYELMPYSNGLNRNIVQCLDDYGIPLYLSHTVVDIKGDRRLEQLVIAQVDENRRPIAGSEKTIDCDTLLLSVGLVPENELSRQAGIEIDPKTGGPVVYENMETSVPGIFACGNVAHVHDLVDFVTEESSRAGKEAAAYCLGSEKNGAPEEEIINVRAGRGVGYTVPQKIRRSSLDSRNKIEIFLRSTAIFKDVKIAVKCGNNIIAAFKREHMAPGEMDKLSIPKALFPKIKDNLINIEIIDK